MAYLSNRQALQRLADISRSNEQTREYKKLDGTVRHKCFLSYHAEDADEVLRFVDTFDSAFIPKCLGVREDEPWIDSENTDYILDKIREKYLSDSTVTIVLIGSCTWARKFVDWEVYSSLRRGSVNRLNGLLAIQLPSAASTNPSLPQRVGDNVIRDKNNDDVGYARYYTYPRSTAALQSWIQDAFDARTSRDHLIQNGAPRKKYNSAC